MPALEIALGFPESERDRVVDLLRAYEMGIGVSLCFQNFEREMAGLPGDYAPPRGAFATARADGRIIGLIALRPLAGFGHVCEMKRLYVSPEARGLGAGRRLVALIMEEARRLGYRRIVLDTLPMMVEAQALYRDLGFEEIAPFNDNPVPGVLFMGRELGEPRG